MPTHDLNCNMDVSLDWLSPKMKLIISENQISKDARFLIGNEAHKDISEVLAYKPLLVYGSAVFLHFAP